VGVLDRTEAHLRSLRFDEPDAPDDPSEPNGGDAPDR